MKLCDKAEASVSLVFVRIMHSEKNAVFTDFWGRAIKQTTVYHDAQIPDLI